MKQFGVYVELTVRNYLLQPCVFDLEFDECLRDFEFFLLTNYELGLQISLGLD